MRKNQALSSAASGVAEACVVEPSAFEPRTAPRLARRLREALSNAFVQACEGRLPVRVPAAGGDLARGEGHFHLAPELFLQLAGWTRFRFPHGELQLSAGEALLLPPKLLHAETVGASAGGEAFGNLVIYAEAATLTCHLAHEASPGRPAILHLEASRHPQALRVQDWLSDAARLGPPGHSAAAAWPLAAAQRRALVAAAIAGVMRSFDDPDTAECPEPALVARVRVLMQNQLGDPALSVRRLAEHSGCTPDYLSHVFSRATGEHLAGFIVRQRLARAARLLAESGMAGKEIAWACGFATQSYFSRSFRTHYGLSPKA